MSEVLYVKKIESGIRGVRFDTKTPMEANVGHFLTKLKPLNEGLYLDLLEKYKGVLNDHKKRNK